MSSAVTYPVQIIREHLTELEAALSVCLTEPDTKSVHKLRTESRRVQALLLLLALVPGLPEHRKQAAAFLRVIATLRRAAGEVRDLDVHRKMLEFLTSRTQKADEKSSSGTKPAKGLVNNSAELSKSARKLRKHMGAERDKAAAKLQKLLGKRQTKTARAAESLMSVLEPAKDLALPAQDVLRDADSVLARDGLLKLGDIAEFKEKDLHTVRKAAKAARYVAESVEDDPALNQAARAFESLQDAGGQWHDALELAKASRRCFGKDHSLTALYRKERDRKLEAYRAALKSRVADEESTEKRKPAKQTLSKRKAAP